MWNCSAAGNGSTWTTRASPRSAITPLGRALCRGARALSQSLDLGIVGNANVAALNAGGASSFPTWSHDGAFISFSSNRAGGLGGWDIWFAPIDPLTAVPGAAVNLREANTADFDHVARWSP